MTQLVKARGGMIRLKYESKGTETHFLLNLGYLHVERLGRRQCQIIWFKSNEYLDYIIRIFSLFMKQCTFIKPLIILIIQSNEKHVKMRGLYSLLEEIMCVKFRNCKN